MVDPESDDFWPRWIAIEPSVKRLCRRYTRGNDSAEHEDLCQEVFLRAQRGYRDLREKERFSVWTYRIAENLCKFWLRRNILERSRQIVSTGDDDSENDLLASYPDKRPNPESAKYRSEVISARLDIPLRAFRAGWISEKEFRVIRMRFNSEDRSWEEIGEALGLGKSDCASAHCRGIEKLRAYLFARHHQILGDTKVLHTALARASASDSRDALTPEEYAAFSEIVVAGNQQYCKAGWRTHLRAACEKVSRQFTHDNHAIYLRNSASGETHMDEIRGLDTLEIVIEGGRKCYLSSESAENPLDRGIVEAILNRLHRDSTISYQSGKTLSFGDAVDVLSRYQVRVGVGTHESLEEIALLLEQEHVSLLAVNAGGLWNDGHFYDFGTTNHLVLPIQCFRDLRSSQIEGFAAFETSSAALHFVSAEALTAGWLEHGGVALDAGCSDFLENLQ